MINFSFKATHIKLLMLVVLTAISTISYGQSRQEDTTQTYDPIIPLDKQGRLKNISIIANQQFGLRNDFVDGDYTGSKFKFEQFRLEVKGYVHKNVYFRFRHRYTSTFEPQSVDKIIKGVDFAYVRFDLGEKTQLTLGKTFADWGGWEFDLNPISIYEYSDIIEMADNFLTGVGIYHQLTPNHGFSLQALNPRTTTFDEIYDTVPNITPAKTPIAGVFNWRGNFFDGRVSTLWSYSMFKEAEGVVKNYIALGTKFTSRKFDISYDYKWSNEDLDRTGIISNDIPDNLYNYSVENTLYQSHWVRAEYRFIDRWQLCLDAFVDYADWKSDIDPIKTEDRFRTAYGFVPTIEFFPWDDLNLKFFAGYVGRIYDYSEYAENRPGFGLTDYTTGRVIIGFISPLQVL